MGKHTEIPHTSEEGRYGNGQSLLLEGGGSWEINEAEKDLQVTVGRMNERRESSVREVLTGTGGS